LCGFFLFCVKKTVKEEENRQRPGQADFHRSEKGQKGGKVTEVDQKIIEGVDKTLGNGFQKREKTPLGNAGPKGKSRGWGERL